MEKSVLLVEDQPAQAEVLRQRLIGTGADLSVEVAPTLEAAAERLSYRTFDLIVLDLGLPDSGGHATFAAVNLLSRSRPIIVITVADDPVDRRRIEDAGVSKYFIKGRFTDDEFKSAVLTAIGNKMSVPAECPIVGASVGAPKPVDPFRLVKRAAAVVVAVTVVTGMAASAGDTRWATVAMVRESQNKVLELVEANQARILLEIRYSADQVRKMALEDEIYKFQEVPDGRLSDSQRAQLARALRQLAELNARWINPPPGSK